jgi:uncharacterized protein (DUF934 family)
MALMIRDGIVVADPWLRLERNADGGLPAVPPAGDIIVPLAMWREQRARLLGRPGRLGVWLEGREEPSTIAEDLKLLGVVAVHFPRFTDGRGYSTARLLRERYGYRGELRATGDVIRDVLFHLSSCGFNAFELRQDEDPREALAGLRDFSETYQGRVGVPLPLFRRRKGA